MSRRFAMSGRCDHRSRPARTPNQTSQAKDKSDRNKRYRNKRGRKFRANLRNFCKNNAKLRNFCANFAQIRQISRKFGKFCMFPHFFDLHPRLLHHRLFRSKVGRSGIRGIWGLRASPGFPTTSPCLRCFVMRCMKMQSCDGPKRPDGGFLENIKITEILRIL